MHQHFECSLTCKEGYQCNIFLADCRPVRLTDGNGLTYRHHPTLVGYLADLVEIASVLNISVWPSEYCDPMSLCSRSHFDDPDYVAPRRSEAQAKQVQEVPCNSA